MVFVEEEDLLFVVAAFGVYFPGDPIPGGGLEK
jgi:hypothetical protein